MKTPNIFITTGPESAGKTTLAQDLARELLCPLVEEASRPYLLTLMQGAQGYRYNETDLLKIARLQHKWEQDALAASPDHLVCDTDLLVIVIWSEVRFGRCDPEILELLQRSMASTRRRYLLCDPALPWEPDPLRENPHDRDKLFALYEAKLQNHDQLYLHVQGSKEQRLRHALSHFMHNFPTEGPTPNR